MTGGRNQVKAEDCCSAASAGLLACGSGCGGICGRLGRLDLSYRLRRNGRCSRSPGGSRFLAIGRRRSVSRLAIGASERGASGKREEDEGNELFHGLSFEGTCEELSLLASPRPACALATRLDVDRSPVRDSAPVETDNPGRISKAGDRDVRMALYTAAHALMTRSDAWSTLKAWGLRLAKVRGHRRAVVAVARKLAVILHRMWVDGTDFRAARLQGVQ